MTNIRSEITSIVEDPKWCALFEARLKKSYNHQNIAFWKAAYMLKREIEKTADINSADASQLMDEITQTYFDTESAQSVALSFKVKQRLKRARSNGSAKDAIKALTLAQGEVELLLISEVKAFLAVAPPPSKPVVRTPPPSSPTSSSSKKVPALRSSPPPSASPQRSASPPPRSPASGERERPERSPRPPKSGRRGAPETAPSEKSGVKSYSDTTAVFSWGNNVHGQLGLGEPSVGSAINIPVQVTGLQNHKIKFMQCTEKFSAWVTDEGATYVAGKAHKSCSPQRVLQQHKVRQIACGQAFSIVVTVSGKVLYYGTNGAVERLPLPEVVTRIACGARHCVALTEEGHVYCWGSNEFQQLGFSLSDATQRKPRLCEFVSNVADIAAQASSTVTLSAQGALTAWGKVVPGSEPQALEELRHKDIVHVQCCDRYVVGLSDLGRIYIWHGSAVEALSIPALPNPFTCLRTNSVYDVACASNFLAVLTDVGDIITWGEYGPYLGQGPLSSFKRYADTPRRISELRSKCIRRISCSEEHIIACTGDGTSEREKLLWELFCQERQYCRALFSIVEVYSRRIKIKSTNVFDNAKTLMAHHRSLLRRLIDLLRESAEEAAVGELYMRCLMESPCREIYEQWEVNVASPLEKLSKPKLRQHLAEIEKEAEAVIKKTDSEEEAARSYSLVSMLKEPGLQFNRYEDLFVQLLSATPQSHSDHEALSKLYDGISVPAVQPSSPKPAAVTTPPRSRVAGMASSSEDAGRNRLANSGLVVPSGSSSDPLRIRALETENKILEDANAQLSNYATALEAELIALAEENQRHSSSLALEAIQKLEEDLVSLAKENAALQQRLKVMEVYKARAENLSRPGSNVSSPTAPRAAFSKAKSTGNVLMKQAMGSAIKKKQQQVPPMVRSDSANLEALRKRMNPAAGRLLSERQGAGHHSLRNFTFDEGASNGDDPVFQNGELKAASLEKLLEHLTRTSGSLAVETFLISYRNFAQPQDILRRLVYMYCIAPADKASVVWLRVLNFLKNWVQKFFEEDWAHNKELSEDLFNFLDEIVGPSGAANKTVEATISTIKNSFNKGPKRENSSRQLIPPRPKTRPSLASQKPHVIAEQLILIEHEIFCCITPGECFNQNWVKKSAQLSPNIKALTDRFNKVGRWVAFEIARLADIRERKTMVEKFIAVASICKEEYNAFGTVMEIMGGLQLTPVFRLKKTWDMISRNSQSTFQELKVFVNSENNWHNLRTATRTAELPCLPYIGTYLGDLTFIDAGAPDYTKVGLINWSKFQRTANAILQLQAKQKTNYTFDISSELYSYLYHIPSISEDELYTLSKEAEPKKSGN